MRNRRIAIVTVGACALVSGLAAPSLAAAELKPFGHACKSEHGVRFCPTETLAQRVPTWDGVPLDADVTLPETGEGPFPTIVIMHGWGGSKTSYEATTPAGDGNVTFDWNNVYYAQHGYAVLNYTARGFGNSCGSEASRKETPGCEKGWVHLSDQRYEGRDTQYLLGILADEKIVKPKLIGVTGISYGGGQSIELAYLKNRVRLPKGEFVPWTSAKGKAMEIKAAYPRWLFSDLTAALTPNGRFLDTQISPFGQSYEPLGVELQSYDVGLYADGLANNGYYAPLGEDPEADISKWFAATNAGEPETPEDGVIARQVYNYHQGYGGIPLAGTPAALLLQNGWTDGVFPVEQALHVYNQVRALRGYAALVVGDLGHAPASNKVNTDEAFNTEGASFFAAKLKHQGLAPRNGSVVAYTMTCPKGAPGGGPFTARAWAKLHAHTLTLSSSQAKTFTSAGGNSTIAAEFDPIKEDLTESGGNVCKETKAEEEQNTANYTMTSPGFTLMGLPTITATVKTTGTYPEMAARLWDVLPSGEQREISRAVWRFAPSEENATSTITFQLHGNAYEFAKGDIVKVQLLGRDSPTYHASNGTFALEVSKVTVSFPTL